MRAFQQQDRPIGSLYDASKNRDMSCEECAEVWLLLGNCAKETGR